MEENDEIINFVGFMKIEGNDQNEKVYFNSDDEEDMISNGLLYFVKKDFNGKVTYLLINPRLGHLRRIEYEKEKS